MLDVVISFKGFGHLVVTVVLSKEDSKAIKVDLPFILLKHCHSINLKVLHHLFPLHLMLLLIVLLVLFGR